VYSILVNLQRHTDLFGVNLALFHGPQRFMSPNTISQLQHLKELRIDCASYMSGADGRTNLYIWLTDLVDQLPNPCSIKVLHVQPRFWLLEEAEQEVAFWNVIDAKLANRQRFPQLANVRVDVHIDTLVAESVEEEGEGEPDEERHYEEQRQEQARLEALTQEHASRMRNKFFPTLFSRGHLADSKRSD
jgi:hypothetical protein